MTRIPIRPRAVCGLTSVGLLAGIVLFTAPVLAQDASTVTDFLSSWQNWAIRLAQGGLVFAIIYFIGVLGVGSGRSEAVKRLAGALIALYFLENLHNIFVNPATESATGNGGGSGTTDAIGVVDAPAAIDMSAAFGASVDIPMQLIDPSLALIGSIPV
jgi:hypothetical protein